jgi:hypothetical protein
MMNPAHFMTVFQHQQALGLPNPVQAEELSLFVSPPPTPSTNAMIRQLQSDNQPSAVLSPRRSTRARQPLPSGIRKTVGSKKKSKGDIYGFTDVDKESDEI